MKLISDKVYNELESLDDLIYKMSHTLDGREIHGVGNIEAFKQRFDMFKEFLKRNIPELTFEEILKFHEYHEKFRSIYEWCNVEYLLTALEYETRNNH